MYFLFLYYKSKAYLQGVSLWGWISSSCQAVSAPGAGLTFREWAVGKRQSPSRLESHEDALEPHKDGWKSMFVLAASDLVMWVICRS